MKPTKIMLVAWATAMASLSLDVNAQETNNEATDLPENEQELEEIVVLGREISTQAASIKVEQEIMLDTSAALKRLPGADVNSNGRVTGIAQYRGMYGDRVSVTIDGIGMIGGGPNAMDTPLSYVSPMITEELILERGIPGVSSAPESIGGHVDATLARGEFTDSSDLGLAGKIGTRYADNGNNSTSAGRLTLANSRHKLSVLAETDRADDVSTPAGTIFPSGLSRTRSDLSYAFSSPDTQLLFFAGLLNTEDAGTPALAMDIRLIDTQMFGTRLQTTLTPGITLRANIAYNDVEHEMDNFSLRTAPDDPMRYRMNSATGSGTVFNLGTTFEAGDQRFEFGLDGKLADHDSLISNPENPMFSIENFTNVQRDITGVFAVWRRSVQDSNWEAGLRYNQTKTDAGTVSASGMMGMMADAANMLAMQFNQASRDRRFKNMEAVVKYRRLVFGETELRVEFGSKTRAPSYQELYLWLPLQATGGLADGRNYIGDLDLNSERSNEVNIGLGWTGSKLELSPQVFFKKIDDYIQGVPTENTAANMLSMMMGGSPALQFANVAAEIYGFDLAWKYQFSDRIFLDGIASYARGRRTDIDDNLYRLAPFRASLSVNYVASSWSIRTEVASHARQDKVSSFNNEQVTAGYSLINAAFAWHPTESVTFELQADNLFDRSYQGHLAGTNRVRDSDIPVGTKLFGSGRTLSAGVIVRF